MPFDAITSLGACRIEVLAIADVRVTRSASTATPEFPSARRDAAADAQFSNQ